MDGLEWFLILLPALIAAPICIWMWLDIRRTNRQIDAYKQYGEMLRRQSMAEWRERNGVK